MIDFVIGPFTKKERDKEYIRSSSLIKQYDI